MSFKRLHFLLRFISFIISVSNVLGAVDYGMEQSGIADVALILDTSTYSLDDDVYQNQVHLNNIINRLNRLTLGQHKSDNIKTMIILIGKLCVLFWYKGTSNISFQKYIIRDPIKGRHCIQIFQYHYRIVLNHNLKRPHI